jgi:hypothetical protein
VFPRVFRLDLELGTIDVESVDLAGVPQIGAATAVALAEDGYQIAFVTRAALSGAPVFDPNAWARNAPPASFREDCAGIPATCPCSNVGAADHGCANSVDAAGARLRATGTPRVAADALMLVVTGLPPSSPVLFVQSATSSPSTGALPFGDGVVCLTGSLARLAVRSAQFGSAQLGTASDPRISQLGFVPASGATVRYQAVYRNAANYCTSDTFNMSNSIAVQWVS